LLVSPAAGQSISVSNSCRLGLPSGRENDDHPLNYTLIDSPWAFWKAQTWITECLSTHTSCQLTPSNFRPTRVLDVRPGKQNAICLVETSQKSGAISWAALSYVWGGPQLLRTTKHSIQSHYQGINLDDMPQTLVDAVEVCRRISVPYLWVDSLCIIQDDPNDLEAELGSMAHIYQHAKVTVAAASASSVQQGFLQNYPLYYYADRGPPIQLYHANSETNRPLPGLLLWPGHYSRHEDSDPIFKRAWTYQERMLSPRFLQYSTGGMLWRCRHHVLSADTKANLDYFQDNDKLLQMGPSLPGSNKTMMSSWDDIMKEYSKLSLTYQGDKLNAVAGVAAVYQQETGKTYLAGLWKEDMPWSLAWFSAEHGSKTPRFDEYYVGPSWSWASITSPTRYFGTAKGAVKTEHASVVHAQIEPLMPGAPLAACKSASLVLRGRLYRAELRVRVGQWTRRMTYAVAPGTPFSIEESVLIYPDAWEDGWRDGDDETVVLGEGEDAWLFPLFTTAKTDMEKGVWTGVVLTKTASTTAGGQPVYRRIALFLKQIWRHHEEAGGSFGETFAEFEDRDVTIV